MLHVKLISNFQILLYSLVLGVRSQECIKTSGGRNKVRDQHFKQAKKKIYIYIYIYIYNGMCSFALHARTGHSANCSLHQRR